MRGRLHRDPALPIVPALGGLPNQVQARHTAGQRVLDHTGNLKAVQKLLGHSSIQTTGDIYADWDIDQRAKTMADVLGDDDPRTTNVSFARRIRKAR
ncbi:MAG TPA: tyrosine-type recombinase/integrase [Solirubrobacteraceae bacterium]|nr:tyrosine-type recombinase/integrase [Solirubrobacteraceae bacterium]